MPVSGRLEALELPQDAHLRIDSAIFPGYEVSPFYDSLMAKVIAWGKNRENAIETLSNGLAHFQLQGVTHNIPLVQWVLANDDFKKGTFNTQTLPKIVERMNNAAPELSEKERVAVAAAALGSFFGGAQGERSGSPWKGYGRMSQMSPRSGRGGRW